MPASLMLENPKGLQLYMCIYMFVGSRVGVGWAPVISGPQESNY